MSETFAAMLQDELDRARPSLLAPQGAPLRALRLGQAPAAGGLRLVLQPQVAKLPRIACFELQTLKFVGEGANSLIIGKSGTGMSHVAKAAYQATLQGYKARYVEADGYMTKHHC